jgi:hypothetical protein
MSYPRRLASSIMKFETQTSLLFSRKLTDGEGKYSVSGGTRIEKTTCRSRCRRDDNTKMLT